ncbi:MAG: hypothetical protein WC069_02085 [Candidatus Shapirobacteria bacterium]
MIKKIFFVIVNCFFVLYLILPVPAIKDLSNSVKSTLPGDTIQLKNVEGYYTNLSRTEVMKFYQSIYSSPFLIRLNHPPEKSKEIFRDTMQSYYLEEFIIPFKQSIFINGFEWEKDVFTKPEKRVKNKLIYENISYSSKINTKLITTTIPVRLVTLFVSEIGIYLIYLCYKKFFTKNAL